MPAPMMSPPASAVDCLIEPNEPMLGGTACRLDCMECHLAGALLLSMTCAAPPAVVAPPSAVMAVLGEPPMLAVDPSLSGLAADATRRLASRLALDAFSLVRTAGVTAQEIDVALDMTLVGARIDPDSIEAWRDVLALADLIGQGEESAATIRSQALDQLVRLQPKDQVVLLRKLGMSIAGRQTAEARMKAYELALSSAYTGTLAPPVASRLALDAALLQNRLGDAKGFESWLGRACTIDPSNPLSAEMRAGLSASLDAPEVIAQDLVAAIKANPASYELYSRLARLLSSQGAYEGARRMARNADFAIRPQFDLQGFDPITPIVVERCLAEWAAGSTEQARRRLHEYDQLRQQVFRAVAQRQGLVGTKQDIESLGIAPDGQVEVLRLALELADLSLATAGDSAAPSTARVGAPAAVSTVRKAVLDGLDAQARDLGQHEDASPAQRVAPLLLGAQLCAASMGDESETRAWLARVESIAPLDPKALARFEGWIALKRGDASTAERHFAESDPDAPMTMLGQAEVHRLAGRAAESLALLQSLATRDAAGPIGLLARTRWEAQSGKTLTLPQASVFERIAMGVPVFWDAVLRGEKQAVLIEGRPVDTTLRPFDPLLIRLTLTNVSPTPLALDEGGPIMPSIAAQPTRLQGGTANDSPSIVQLDSDLALAPGASVSVESDMRRWPVGLAAEQRPLESASITFRAISNPVFVGRGVTSGALGAEAVIEPMIVTAPVTNDAWIESAMAAIRNPDVPTDLLDAALLMWVGAASETQAKSREDDLANAVNAAEAATRVQRAADLEAIERAKASGQVPPAEREPVKPKPIDESKYPLVRWQDPVWDAVASSIARMPPHAQAWLLLISPGRSQGMDKVRDAVRSIEDPVVRLCYLYGAIVTQDDPVMAEELASSDPVRVHRAQGMQTMLRRNLQGALDLRKLELDAQREFDLTSPKSP